VPERAQRRRFTAKYKTEILAAYDAAAHGEKGALLRRERLYSSHLVAWRRARDAGALAALPAPRGRKRRDPQQETIARLEAEKQRLEQELAKARSGWMCKQNCTGSWRGSPRARTPSRGRRRDRHGDRRADPDDRGARCLPGGGCGAGRLLPPAPAESATATADPGWAP
jgi:hypothetical protein